nr:N-acetyltransferase GCN5 [uncultured Mediterranean phage uvMED]
MIKMQYAEESYNKVKDDIKPLLEKHWEQIAINKETIKLNPDWDEYQRLYFAGNLKIFTARDNEELVGYFITVVARNLHYKDHLFAQNDVLYVKPDKRAGMTGFKLIKYAEIELKKMGVSVIHINTKVHAPFDSLMERMGYSLIERLYSKYIG